MYSFSYLEPVCCSMSSSNCCFLTWIQISQEAGQVVWYFHLFQSFPQFLVIHTVKGFGIVNKAEIDVFPQYSSVYFLKLMADFPNSVHWKGDHIKKLITISCMEKPNCIMRDMDCNFILISIWVYWTSLVAQMIKNLPAMQGTRVWSLGREDPLENGMATHSSTLGWRMLGTEEPGGLQSMGLQRVGHNWVTHTRCLLRRQDPSASCWTEWEMPE